jgi:hypothetical protein
MRIPHTERLLYFSLQLDHFELAAERDIVRRSNWSPGYYGTQVPLLTPTLDAERCLPQDDGTTGDVLKPQQTGHKPDAGQADT